ncbi:hypothetical protein [Corynebacterium cystitidis]|uniref:hypothetical protein n=1 Tax=Corynebacterium cystitidis TaxID=35757 RepID=UPI00211E9901|nr:hypothetical protein [Corynebacterium cystitidis]
MPNSNQQASTNTARRQYQYRLYPNWATSKHESLSSAHTYGLTSVGLSDGSKLRGNPEPGAQSSDRWATQARYRWIHDYDLARPIAIIGMI